MPDYWCGSQPSRKNALENRLLFNRSGMYLDSYSTLLKHRLQRATGALWPHWATLVCWAASHLPSPCYRQQRWGKCNRGESFPSGCVWSTWRRGEGNVAIWLAWSPECCFSDDRPQTMAEDKPITLWKSFQTVQQRVTPHK